MYPKLTQRTAASGEIVYTYVCKMKERSKGQRCGGRNANGNRLDDAVIRLIKDLTVDDGLFAAMLERSRRFFVEKLPRSEGRLERLRTEQESNEKIIVGLMDTMALAGDDMTRARILKRIEELGQTGREIETQIRELEGLAAKQCFGEQEFDTLCRTLSVFCTSVDGMSVEEKRAAVRAVVHRVVWDGKNAHVVLLGAEETEIENSELWGISAEFPEQKVTHWGEDSK